MLKTLILLINNNSVYKGVLQQAGLMDVMVIALKSYSEEESEANKVKGNGFIFLLLSVHKWKSNVLKIALL